MLNLFKRRFRIKEEDIKMIRPTSKAALKSQCLLVAKGDVEQAEKLYDFYIKDMDELPMFDVVPPSTMQNITQTAGNIFGWVKENGNDIAQAVQLVKSIMKNGNVPSANVPLPPIN